MNKDKIYNAKICKIKAKSKGKFNWESFGLWICSIVVSLLPLYILGMQYLAEHNRLDKAFWVLAFVKGDVLWVFSTVLLFSLIDSVSKKRNREKKWVKGLQCFGLVVFLFSEGTWIYFNVNFPQNYLSNV